MKSPNLLALLGNCLMISRLKATNILKFFLPFALQHRFFHKPVESSEKRRVSSAWLDGLRGVAALFVCFCHFTNIHSHKFHRGYGVDDNYEIYQLPIVSIFYSGGGMIFLFFV